MRPGITLLELLLAMSIGTVAAGLALYAYTGADKAKSLTVASNLMKVSGQSGMERLTKDIARARRIFDRNQEWLLDRLPIEGFHASGTEQPGLLPNWGTHLILPEIKTAGSLGPDMLNSSSVQVANPNFDKASVGNALMFLTEEAPIAIDDGGAITGEHSQTFGTRNYRLSVYRFHLIYLAQRDLPLRAPRVRPDAAFVYQLTHFISKPYLMKGELDGWMAALRRTLGTSTADTFIDTKLTSLRTATDKDKLVGALNFDEIVDGKFFFKVERDTTTDSLKQEAATVMVAAESLRQALDAQMKGAFGDQFMAFNTAASGGSPSVPAVPVRSLGAPYSVPSYANVATKLPYGFETMVVGRLSARRVLLRLALCTRTVPGNVLVGEPFQQVITMSEF